MDVSDKILQCLRDQGQLTTAEILKSVVAPERSIYDHLAKLVRSGQVVKVGRRPYVSYRLAGTEQVPNNPTTTTKPTTQDSPPASFWTNFLARFNIDAQLVQKRYDAIHAYLYPAYDQWLWHSRHPSNVFLSLIHSAYNSVIWIAALVSVLMTRGANKKIDSPLPAGRQDAPGADRMAGLIKMIILLSIAVIIGYQIHSWRFSYQIRQLQNQLGQSQGETTPLKMELTNTKEQLYLSQQRVTQLQERQGLEKQDVSQQVQKLRQAQQELRQEQQEARRQWQKQEQELRSQLRAQQDELRQEEDKAGAEKKQLQNELAEAKEQLSKIQGQAQQFQEKSSVLKSQLEQAQDQSFELKSKLEQAQEQSRKLEDQLAQKDQQIQQLKEQPIDSTKNTKFIDQVITLTKQRLSNAEIIQYIKDNQGSYHLTTADAQYMRSWGVDEGVIKVME